MASNRGQYADHGSSRASKSRKTVNQDGIVQSPQAPRALVMNSTAPAPKEVFTKVREILLSVCRCVSTGNAWTKRHSISATNASGWNGRRAVVNPPPSMQAPADGISTVTNAELMARNSPPSNGSRRSRPPPANNSTPPKPKSNALPA